jgi:hypothetical protein
MLRKPKKGPAMVHKIRSLLFVKMDVVPDSRKPTSRTSVPVTTIDFYCKVKTWMGLINQVKAYLKLSKELVETSSNKSLL